MKRTTEAEKREVFRKLSDPSRPLAGFLRGRFQSDGITGWEEYDSEKIRATSRRKAPEFVKRMHRLFVKGTK